MSQFDVYDAPTKRPGDSQAMLDAIDWLNLHRIPFTRPTDHQLKIGNLSFYPNRGTIFRDGDPAALKEKGLPALQALLHPNASPQGPAGQDAQNKPPHHSPSPTRPRLVRE